VEYHRKIVKERSNQTRKNQLPKQKNKRKLVKRGEYPGSSKAKLKIGDLTSGEDDPVERMQFYWKKKKVVSLGVIVDCK